MPETDTDDATLYEQVGTHTVDAIETKQPIESWYFLFRYQKLTTDPDADISNLEITFILLIY